MDDDDLDMDQGDDIIPCEPNDFGFCRYCGRDMMGEPPSV